MSFPVDVVCKALVSLRRAAWSQEEAAASREASERNLGDQLLRSTSPPQRGVAGAGPRELSQPLYSLPRPPNFYDDPPPSSPICLCACGARGRAGQGLDCFQSLPSLMMDYHVNLNGIGLICFNDFSLG